MATVYTATNGCTIGTVLRSSSVVRRRLSVTLSIVDKRCVLKQKLLLTAYSLPFLVGFLMWHSTNGKQ